MKQLILFFGLLLHVGISFAQQESSFSHYMFNQQIVNPAYSGARGLTNFTSVVRSQWSGIEGAPRTQTLSFNTPIKSKNLGFGLSVLNDRLGPLSTTSIDIDFAYHLRLNRKDHRLSIGLKGGALSYLLDGDRIITETPNDPSFVDGLDRKIIPNIGFGFYYYTQKIYLGLSVPRLIEDKNFGSVRHAYFLTGGLFNINKTIMIKPSLMIKHTEAISDFDVSVLGIVNKLFWVGAQVRNRLEGDGIRQANNFGMSALFGLSLGEKLSIGYSYGIPSSISNIGLGSSTHEFMLRFDLTPKVNGYLRSPRFF